MSRRTLKASSARPSQTPLEGRTDVASTLTTNTVAHPPAAFHAGGTPECVAFGRGHLLSQQKAREGPRYRSCC